MARTTRVSRSPSPKKTGPADPGTKLTNHQFWVSAFSSEYYHTREHSYLRRTTRRTSGIIGCQRVDQEESVRSWHGHVLEISLTKIPKLSTHPCVSTSQPNTYFLRDDDNVCGSSLVVWVDMSTCSDIFSAIDDMTTDIQDGPWESGVNDWWPWCYRVSMWQLRKSLAKLPNST